MTSMYMNNFSSRDAIITLVASTMGMDEETAKSYLRITATKNFRKCFKSSLCR